MPRDSDVRLDDIHGAAERVRNYVAGMSRQQFEEDTRTVDAVIRCLEVIGEAVKSLPDEVRARRPDVPWSRIAGLRDILIHQYFGVDEGILWDVITTKLDLLDEAVVGLRRKSEP